MTELQEDKRTLQYFHWTPNKKLGNNNGTYLVEVPTYEELTLAVFTKADIEIRVSHAKLNPLDQFCKKTGREVATARMEALKDTKELTYTVVPALWNLMNDHLILKSTNGTLVLALHLRGPGKKPFLLQVEE